MSKEKTRCLIYYLGINVANSAVLGSPGSDGLALYSCTNFSPMPSPTTVLGSTNPHKHTSIMKTLVNEALPPDCPALLEEDRQQQRGRL